MIDCVLSLKTLGDYKFRVGWVVIAIMSVKGELKEFVFSKTLDGDEVVDHEEEVVEESEAL